MKGLNAPVIFLLLVFSFGCLPSSDNNAAFFFTDHVGRAEADYDRDRFLSVRKDGLLSAPITLQAETRISLTPPLPSRLSFTVQLPQQPILRYAIAVKTLGDPDDWAAVEFRLSVTGGAEMRTVFVEGVDRSRPNRWMDRQVDLAPWSGQNVRLTFETKLRPPANRDPGTLERILPLWGNPVLVGAKRAGERPNLVLISVDCLRADHVGTYGYHRETTPNIDKLAADGVVFETAISTSSWTIPAHMSMFTGLLPSFHGVTKIHKLDGAIPYLPELLARSGYHTSGVASWVYLSQAFGFERGFHIYEALVREETRANEVVDVAIEQARRGEPQSQFLFLHLFDPHAPYLPKRELLDRFGPRPADISDLHDEILRAGAAANEVKTKELVQLYDSEIAYVDKELGRFFDELKAMGLYHRSLIMLTADHGEAFYEHDHWQHTESLYEEIVRVPLIVKWPQPSPKGRVKEPVSQVDIFASLLEVAGIPPPPTSARDLARFVREKARASDLEPAISEVTWSSPNNETAKISFRTGERKYIATLSRSAGGEGVSRLVEEELYDLVNDPRETRNLLPEAATDAGSFRRQMWTFLDKAKRSREGRRSQPVELDEATRERLRALGYTWH